MWTSDVVECGAVRESSRHRWSYRMNSAFSHPKEIRNGTQSSEIGFISNMRQTRVATGPSVIVEAASTVPVRTDGSDGQDSLAQQQAGRRGMVPYWTFGSNEY